MARNDWFRNLTWNDAIATVFFAKLQRSRGKSQYLKIQAGTLAHKYPRIALELLDRYFELDDRFFDAEAFCIQAQSYEALGRVSDALAAYDRALQLERELPNYTTNAWNEYAYLVVRTAQSERYTDALAVLDREKGDSPFPAHVFLRHALAAILLSRLGDTEIAKGHAMHAKAASMHKTTNLRYHARLGLVGNRYKDLLE